jgi:leukotriene-A4 hydrolase
MKLLDLPPLTALLLACLPFVLACATSGGTTPARPATPGRPGAPPSPPGEPVPAVPHPARDEHSFSHPDEVTVEHLKLDLTVDFNSQKLTGRASLKLAHKGGSTQLHLDTRDLDIKGVTLDDGRTAAKFTLGEEVRFLGRELTIEITPKTQWVSIDYSTRPEAAALQWLTPVQAGGTKPLLFSQSEAILARTWIPCQDSPGVRMTYEATLHVPSDLLALMSAENPTTKRADGVYHFQMPQAIPSYLLAIAVGDLEFRPLGAKSGVYALPSVIAPAAAELVDIPRMMAAAEKLYGPYRWGRYDVLILPGSYPFGGMEHPRLTFATPTILAGDRSLVSLIAHELAHSWSGNLVTNATWNDFWLNEGFTVYFERRIMEAISGKDYADTLWVLGRQDLEDTLRELGPESADTHLFLHLAGRDPDEGTSQIAYEKGALFLYAIAEVVGRERWDRFVHGYFEENAFRSMDTGRFRAYLQAHLLADDPTVAQKVPLDAWIDGPGIPSAAPRITAAAFAKVDAQVTAFGKGTAAASLATTGWSTQEWLRFLSNLEHPLPVEKMAALDAAFHFTQSGNSEILADWLERSIESRYEAAYPRLESFLLTVGRRKFLKPLYSALAKTPAGMERALRIYGAARPGYHSVSRQTIDKILDWRG